jgi:hypothetical protein
MLRRFSLKLVYQTLQTLLQWKHIWQTLILIPLKNTKNLNTQNTTTTDTEIDSLTCFYSWKQNKLASADGESRRGIDNTVLYR